MKPSNHRDHFFHYCHPSMSDSGQFVHGAFNTLESLPSAISTLASEAAYTLDDSADYIASSLWQGLGGEGHDFSPNSMFFNSVVDKGWATTGLNTVGALANGAVSPLKALYEDDSYALGEFAAGIGLGFGASKVATGFGVSRLDADSSSIAFDRDGAINAIVDKIGSDVKGNPLRQSYEDKVASFSQYQAEFNALSKLDSTMNELAGLPGQQTFLAQSANQARRDLGGQYKDATPEPLRDFIYERNLETYGDPLGPTYEFLVDVKGKTNADIINAASRPNGDINKTLAPFKTWLADKPDDVVRAYYDGVFTDRGG